MPKAKKKSLNNPCHFCGKDMGVFTHPSKRFCRSKGPGNCKDKYHNRKNPRGYGA